MSLHFKPRCGAPGRPLSRMGQHAAPISTYTVPCHSQSHYERETGICRNDIHHWIWLAEINCPTSIPRANFVWIHGEILYLADSFQNTQLFSSKALSRRYTVWYRQDFLHHPAPVQGNVTSLKATPCLS